LLKEAVPHVEDAFEELQHASLVDLDAKIYAQRAQLHPVVVEAAQLHRLASPEHREAMVDLVIQIYTKWRDQGIEGSS
jgi:hypothetical protein